MKVWILRGGSDDGSSGIIGVFDSKESAVEYVEGSIVNYKLDDEDDDTFWVNADTHKDYAWAEAWTVEGPQAQTNEMPQ